MTTDMWTDLKSRHFIALTVHYISKGTSTLKKHVLTVHHYTDDKKTGENITKTIQELCAIFELPLSVTTKTCYFVTDNASNFKVASTGYHRLPCACYMVTIVLNHTLQLNSMSKTVEKIKNSSPDMMYVTEIREAVANVKSIVENFKRTGLNNKLPVLLKQSNEARWNSSLLMLKTFNEQ